MRRSAREHAAPLLGAELHALGPDQVERTFELHAIDDDPDEVAVADPAQRAAGQGLGADVTDAGTRRDAREPGIGQDGDLLAERQVSQRRGDLEDLLHPRAHRPATDQDQDVAGPDRPVPLPLDGGDRLVLASEDPRRPGLAVDSVVIDHRRVDRGALDDRALGSQVTPREGHRAGESPLPRPGRAHDHVVRIDAVLFGQALAQSLPTLARPPTTPRSRSSGSPMTVASRQVEQAQLAQVEHDLRHTARQERPDGRMIERPIRQDAHQARHPDVDLVPVVDGRPAQAGGERDGRHMQDQVR